MTTLTRTARRLTGLKPTGRLHLGNLVGAIRPIVAAQAKADSESIVFLADLHALTVEHDPARLRTLTLTNTAELLAAGIDPDRTTIYAQSQLPEHAELHYLLECTTGYGEARRMVQFKEKSAGPDRVRLSLLTYPVLMAADVLLHDTDEVPVGADQTQHLELTRDVATRFNARYGDTFVVPRAVRPPVAARVMDLTDPAAKMGKSNRSAAGTIFLLDPPDLVRRKVMRATTAASYDPAQPGVANLLEILAACTGEPDPSTIAGRFQGYGELKAAVADAVIDVLRPIQARHGELRARETYLRQILDRGVRRARPRARATADRARRAIGLLA